MICSSSLRAEDETVTHPKLKELPENKVPEKADRWEFGARFGFGFRGPNRFDQNLNGFTSNLDPRIPSQTKVHNTRGMYQEEFLARTRFGEGFKVGFIAGSRTFDNFGITNLTSEPFYTRLDFQMYSLYFLGMVWQEGRLNRYFRWETGLGLGYARAAWLTNGFATDGKSYYQENGDMRGNGLEFRLEGALNTQVNDSVTLSFGAYLSWINITSFDGSFNGDTSSFYVRQDGRVTPLTESNNQSNILLSNQFSRKLDMQSAYGGLFFGVNYKL
ncbi:hypothetical protein EHQ53_17415 [Leptospira langatensis]|uniref:Uncharacterized protein n=2 Tax=Leptospira langatensis TaxID=2484983 RepID=A0A5F1ZQ37_9LEPT|nr:hypothetical protein EHO57_01655 [Leptospira langatensis]TGL38771.1 hypothetical protein EHQ53_17415 [Leptospira langatensis]